MAYAFMQYPSTIPANDAGAKARVRTSNDNNNNNNDKLNVQHVNQMQHPRNGIK